MQIQEGKKVQEQVSQEEILEGESLKKGKEEQVSKKEVQKGQEIQKQIQESFQEGKEIQEPLKKRKKGLPLSQKPIPPLPVVVPDRRLTRLHTAGPRAPGDTVHPPNCMRATLGRRMHVALWAFIPVRRMVLRDRLLRGSENFFPFVIFQRHPPKTDRYRNSFHIFPNLIIKFKSTENFVLTYQQFGFQHGFWCCGVDAS